ncbi:4Fe-4S ferredoxin iron-sulfur binding domain protein [Desulfatibacillum aliphaticivorans]|uniref:4Fe-4S ferredoxin iron-sulfur binding domain protein n=1 Tax=Desulfatibacillum aliphaticivorans TaxID=218208 RepID=B8FJB4_DESAL|nr:4Fe-4S binding protein [Desulfatibacillum aliphaticivorans]ACL05041.1 4Fe-4S ferredoxin iron-sulfur binding domain protein [Desulfatibacillum aliphaticivorans]
MKRLAAVLGDQGKKHWQARMAYRRLAKHLNAMPVGFPRSVSGVEKRILRSIFTPGEAEAALHLSYKPEPKDVILARASKKGIPSAEMERRLANMEKNGALLIKNPAGEPQICLLPFVIGFFETQIASMNAGLYLDTTQYMAEAMGFEYLSTVPQQMRIVPVEKSITPKHRISTHDEIRRIIAGAGDSIALTTCICRKGRDMLGAPCERTDRRETCMAFHDFGEMYIKNGWARRIGVDEAMEVIALSEKDGLVIEVSNEKNPSFACMCCPCCCGVFNMLAAAPRPADFVQSNFRAALDSDKCVLCGKCEKRCPTQAIKIKKDAVKIDLGKCIGCGLCAAACKPGALTMAPKTKQETPPEDYSALMDAIMANKKGLVGKAASTIRGALGIKR